MLKRKGWIWLLPSCSYNSAFDQVSCTVPKPRSGSTFEWLFAIEQSCSNEPIDYTYVCIREYTCIHLERERQRERDDPHQSAKVEMEKIIKNRSLIFHAWELWERFSFVTGLQEIFVQSQKKIYKTIQQPIALSRKKNLTAQNRITLLTRLLVHTRIKDTLSPTSPSCILSHAPASRRFLELPVNPYPLHALPLLTIYRFNTAIFKLKLQSLQGNVKTKL